jgi:hypothetical protein
MPHTDTGLFTVGVFQDCEWAERGLEALRRHEFPPGALTVLARETSDVEALIQRALGTEPQRVDGRGVGVLLVTGPLLEAFRGASGHLEGAGLAVAMRRLGFQPHDGLIFERLLERGGVLVAVQSESRAADALAVLHAFGAGNAAIGAWSGRL